MPVTFGLRHYPAIPVFARAGCALIVASGDRGIGKTGHGGRRSAAATPPIFANYAAVRSTLAALSVVAAGLCDKSI